MLIPPVNETPLNKEQNVVPKPKNTTKSNVPIKISDSDFQDALKLVPLLKNDDMNYDDWIHRGFVIHNLGLDVSYWIDFSKQSKKYDELKTLKEWSGFQFDEAGYKSGSLHMWVIEDDPDGYNTVMNPFTQGIIHPLLRDDNDDDSHEDLHINVLLLETFILELIGPKGEVTRIIDKDRTVKYLNHYLIYINESNPPQLIEITDLSAEGHIIRKIVGLEKHFNPFYAFFKIWLAS